MIKDNLDVVNRMMYLNQFKGLTVLETKRSLYNQFEELFNDGGTVEYYNNRYEDSMINSFFNGHKVRLWGSV